MTDHYTRLLEGLLDAGVHENEAERLMGLIDAEDNASLVVAFPLSRAGLKAMAPDYESGGIEDGHRVRFAVEGQTPWVLHVRGAVVAGTQLVTVGVIEEATDDTEWIAYFSPVEPLKAAGLGELAPTRPPGGAITFDTSAAPKMAERARETTLEHCQQFLATGPDAEALLAFCEGFCGDEPPAWWPEPRAGCNSCRSVIPLARVAPSDPCPVCGEDALVALVAVEPVFVGSGDAELPDLGHRGAYVEHERVNAALRALGTVVYGNDAWTSVPVMLDQAAQRVRSLDIVRSNMSRALNVLQNADGRRGAANIISGTLSDLHRVYGGDPEWSVEPRGKDTPFEMAEAPFDAESLLLAARMDPAEFRHRYEQAAAHWRRYTAPAADSPEDVRARVREAVDRVWPTAADWRELREKLLDELPGMLVPAPGDRTRDYIAALRETVAGEPIEPTATKQLDAIERCLDGEPGPAPVTFAAPGKRRIDVNGEDGARKAAEHMDWGVVIEEEMSGDVSVYLIGQGAAKTPPDDAEREKAAALLLEVAEGLGARMTGAQEMALRYAQMLERMSKGDPLRAAHDAIASELPAGEAQARLMLSTVQIAIETAKRTALDELRGTSDTTDTERRERAAGRLSGTRARVREAQIEALLPYVTPDGAGEGTDEMRRRAAVRALEAVQDAMIGDVLGGGSVAQAVADVILVQMAAAAEPRTIPTRYVDRATGDVLALLWERGKLLVPEDEWPALFYCRSSLREVGELLTTALGQLDALDVLLDGGVPWADAEQGMREAMEFVERTLRETTLDGERTQILGALRTLTAGEAHVCTCGVIEHYPEAGGCSTGFEDRCRFEAALRSLLGVKAGR